MNVGDLVFLKHSTDDAIGIVAKVDANIHNSVSYRVWVSWNFLDGKIGQNYSWQLEVIT